MTYIWPCQLPCTRTPTHFPYFNAKCSSKHKLPLAEESKQFPARPNFTSAFANVGPGSAATAMPCTWGLGSCTSPSSQAASPGLEAPRTNTLFLSQLLHPAPRPGLSLPLLCHPAGNLFPPHLPTTGSSGLGPRRLGPWFACVSQRRRIYRGWIWGYLELMISEMSLSLWKEPTVPI